MIDVFYVFQSFRSFFLILLWKVKEKPMYCNGYFSCTSLAILKCTNKCKHCIIKWMTSLYKINKYMINWEYTNIWWCYMAKYLTLQGWQPGPYCGWLHGQPCDRLATMASQICTCYQLFLARCRVAGTRLGPFLMALVSERPAIKARKILFPRPNPDITLGVYRLLRFRALELPVQ